MGEKTAFEMVKSLRVPNLEFLRMFISTNEKRNKVLARVEAESHIVERNLKLMRMPMSLSELDYEEKTLIKEKVNANLLKCILLSSKEIDDKRFYAVVNKLELFNVLNEKNRKILNISLVSNGGK